MQKPVRVLIIDDDEDDYFITSDYLNSIPGKSFVIDWCYTYADAIGHIKNAQHDIYLVDYRLGVKTGIDVIKEAVALQCDEPIILLTSKGDFRIDVEAMKQGAFDYLLKADLNSEKLERSIRYAIDRASSLRALKANEKKYRNIFDNSKDAVFVTDGIFNFTEVNQAFCELMSCKKNSLLQMRLDDLLTDSGLKSSLTNTLQKVGTVKDFEIEIKNKEGENRHCILSATREIDLENQAYYQGILHDITFIRRAERLTLQAEKLAAAGRLVRTLAHEVRNPINNINLAVEQLIVTNIKEEDDLYLDIIHRNSNRINELIKELLLSSRPAEIEMSQCTFQSLIDEVLDAAIDRINLKRIQLVLNLPQHTLMIECDRQKIVMALLNIVINAIEAMEEEKGKLVIDAQAYQNKLIIYITDNGSGISEENLPRLFEPYFTSKRNGIGLGLAATLNIIQSHRGTIEATSLENKGTTFTITLPLSVAA
ncbi:MAG: ATP-binding protein [Bacteroidota bacterium]